MKLYDAKIDDYVLYGNTVYRITNVHDVAMVDVKGCFRILQGKLLEYDGAWIPDIHITTFDKRIFLNAKVV